MTTNDRQFDIVVFGATSFVGQILCGYLAREPSDPGLRWAMAARSAAKLESLRKSLGDHGRAVDTFTADAGDEHSLRALCLKTRVVISTVGPYALYGEPLVRACVETGTDYCDLTGEVQWIRRMIDRHEEAARRSGARIIHCCGFDSIPSDLGVYFIQQYAKAELGNYCQQVRMRVKKLRGGMSGGTIASMVNLYKEAARDPALRRELANPYSLCPRPDEGYPAQHEPSVEFDEDFGAWTAPFVMAAINTRIVLRSNALLQTPYHAEFLYDEAMLAGPEHDGKRRATWIARGLKAMGLAMIIPPLRWLALRFLPKPGEGPSPEQQREGHFDLRFVAIDQQGRRVFSRVTGDRDPGYGSTAKMLAQAGICLAKDLHGPQPAGGFWTPATAFGALLIERLVRHAGMRFEPVEPPRSIATVHDRPMRTPPLPQVDARGPGE